MMFELRDYQREGVDDTFARFDDGATRVPVVCATGLGKSVIASNIVDEWLTKNPGKRVLGVAHTYELIDQMVKHMRKTGRRVGVQMGTRNTVTAEIVVASRQTLASEKRRNQLKNVGLIIIDECHFAVRANTYGKILEHFGAFEDEDGNPPTVKVVGFTATLSRSDKQKLSTIWEDCTFSRDIMFGIRNGFLMNVSGSRIVVDQFDMRNVSTKGGDWDASSLGEELERSFAIDTIAKQYLELSQGRKGLAFWPLVATAQHAAEVFNDLGIPSAAVWGAQDKRERARVLADHKAGKILCVHNAMALTVGYDDPSVDVILMGRSTKSRTLYTQMAGRGLRPPEDENGNPVDTRTLDRSALIIDVTGASDSNDLTLFIDLSPEKPLQEAYEANPDATLSELEDWLIEQIEEETDGQRAGASWEFESEEYAGPVTSKSFDPLGRDKVWGKTSGGTYYVKASVNGKADAFVFITDSLTGDPGTYDIVQCSTNFIYNPRYDIAPPWQRGTEHVGLHLDIALSYGEELAGEAFNSRKTSWRRGAPSAGLAGKARMYGINPDGMTSGQVSEAVDTAIADRRIDPLVALVRQNMQQSNA